MVDESVLLDSNLLLLLMIGATDRTLIQRFKRTNEFSMDDFDALRDIVSRAKRIITTPHILTEVSNLANSLHDDLKDDFAETFKAVVAALEERFTMATDLAAKPQFRFGITDVAILNESANALVLTQDRRLTPEIFAVGGRALDLKSAIALGKDVA